MTSGHSHEEGALESWARGVKVKVRMVKVSELAIRCQAMVLSEASTATGGFLLGWEAVNGEDRKSGMSEPHLFLKEDAKRAHVLPSATSLVLLLHTV